MTTSLNHGRIPQWCDVAKAAKEGDRVRFITSWDIFPLCVVPQGTLGTVTENDWIENIIMVLPDDAEVREHLREWAGQVQLHSLYDGDESPIEIL